MTHFAHPLYTVVILAMSADGKIADARRSSARFGSLADRMHLEKQIAQADGVLFGAGTLRAYGTTLSVSQPDLLRQREQQGKPLQPVHIVASRLAEINPNYRFFKQPVPRWLMTTTAGSAHGRQLDGFDRVLVAETRTTLMIDWVAAFQQFHALGLRQLAVLGGGMLVESLLAAGLIDEFWLTVCPIVLGGKAPTPVDGTGFLVDQAPRLQLLSAETIDHEVFLHYKVVRDHQSG